MSEMGLDTEKEKVSTVGVEPEVASTEKESGEASVEEADAGTQTDQQGEASEGLEVKFGDEEPDDDEKTPAPAWVREVRKQNRDLQKKNRELERRLSEKTETVTLPKKPALQDFDFDPDAYEKALSTWYETKRKYDEIEAKKRTEAERSQADWQSKLAAYGQAKGGLGVSDFEDAESAVQAVLDVTQQGIIVQGAENPALLVYALGRNEAKLKELAGIKDPVRFSFAVAKLEATMRVNRKSAPAPEKTVTGGRAVGSNATDSHLAKLREEAARTGDYTKLSAYRRQLRNKGK